MPLSPKSFRRFLLMVAVLSGSLLHPVHMRAATLQPPVRLPMHDSPKKVADEDWEAMLDEIMARLDPAAPAVNIP